jgi:hypothetical protein
VHEGASSWAEQLAGERLTLWRCGWELRSAQLRREGARLAELGEEGAGLERQAQRALRGGSMCARSMLGVRCGLCVRSVLCATAAGARWSD